MPGREGRVKDLPDHRAGGGPGVAPDHAGAREEKMAVTSEGFDRLFQVLMRVRLTATTPPPPPYGSSPTPSRVLGPVRAGAALVPLVYRQHYVSSLESHLPSLVAGLVEQNDLGVLEALAGAVYQHKQTVGRPELRRFLAVISNLYRSFLDKAKRSQAQFPIREQLPPLAIFQNSAAQGPYTLPVDAVHQLIGSDVGVVSLPAAYRDHPFFWASLAHETGGHDVLHADPGLIPELQDGARRLLGGKLGAVWSYWMDEAASDVYGVMNVGPAFALNLAAFFATLIAQLEHKKVPSLRTQSGPIDATPTSPLDPHPTDLLRLHLAIGVVENLAGLSENRQVQYREDLKALARILAPDARSIEIEGSVRQDSGEVITLSDSFPLVDMQDAARRVGGMIATAKLEAFGGHGIQDIETWDDPDEDRALQVAAAMRARGPVTGIGDDAQLLAGLTLAVYENPAAYAEVTRLLDAGLDESFAHDAFWGLAQKDVAFLGHARVQRVRPPEEPVDPLAAELIEFNSLEPGAFDAVGQEALAMRATPPAAIPWPRGKAPKAAPLSRTPPVDQALPRCDYLAITWTVDEANAMATVLTPGFLAAPPSSDRSGNAWYHYASRFADYRGMLRPGTVPFSEHILGRYLFSEFGGKRVVCFKSDLHLARDTEKMPVKKLFQQLIQETRAKLVVTTGTAGAIGGKLQLGDVVVATSCTFHCEGMFKNQPFNGKTFTSDTPMAAREFQLANDTLLPANASRLEPQRRGVPRIFWDRSQLGQLDQIVTTDIFAFDDVRDTFELQGLGSAVEMDDAVLGLACSELSQPQQWLAIRNASDPQMDGSSLGEEKSEAAAIYKKFGFWTTIPSVIATWAAIVGHGE